MPKPGNEYSAIPLTTMQSLQLWITHAVPPGDFLRAILLNDLNEAVQRADEYNLPVLPLIVRWLVNYAPAQCWGSVVRVKSWKGLKHVQQSGDHSADPTRAE